MYSKEVVVRCESGLHNKQATYFVQKANEFESSIWLESGNRKMNAKSLLGIMSLGIISGSTVTLSAVGTDEEAAVTALDGVPHPQDKNDGEQNPPFRYHCGGQRI